jgi:hypothetical protein
MALGVESIPNLDTVQVAPFRNAIPISSTRQVFGDTGKIEGKGATLDSFGGSFTTGERIQFGYYWACLLWHCCLKQVLPCFPAQV